MRKKLMMVMLATVVMQSLIAQPSLRKMKQKIRASRDSVYIGNFQLNEKLPSLGAFRFSEKIKMPQAQALTWLKSQLGLRAGQDELTAMGSLLRTKNNIIVQQVRQYYKGIPVEHGRINITSGGDKTSFMQMEFYSIPDNYNTNPSLTEKVALQKATEYVGATKYAWEGYSGNDPEFQQPAGKLVFVEDIFHKTGRITLAYKFLVYAIQPLSKGYIYVNAENGEIVFTDKIIKHANSPGTGDTRYSGTQPIITDFTGVDFHLRELRNGDSIVTLDYQRRVATPPNDALAVDFVDNDNNWSNAEFNNANYDNAALDAHFGVEKVSDYWKFVHGRNGWDNLNSMMKSYVHIRASAGSGYNNAFWNGSAMYFGDGTYLSGDLLGFLPLTSVDVTAHEMGHAVCQTTAALTYQRESGALNEGFSDIWAACVERYSGLGAPKQNFKLGEEIYPSRGFIRDMQDPNAGNQPDTYFGNLWKATSVGGCPYITGSNDNCGVHTNSGVLNKWFYIATQGEAGLNDNGDTYAVAGLGFAKTEQIAYLAELNLTPNSNFSATRTACINAAITLFGACSNEEISVTDAWFAVGVGNSADCRPLVEFVKGRNKITEGVATPSGCVSKLLNVDVKLGSPATAPVSITFNPGGTAINNIDYTISPAVVTYNVGEFGIKNMVVTILDNGANQGSKMLTLNYTINANGGNGAAGINNQTDTISIVDDDIAPVTIKATPVSTSTLINEDFESVPGAFPPGWTTFFFAGGNSPFNYWTVGSNGGAGISGQSAYITNNLTTKPHAYTITSTTSKVLRTKVFATTGLVNLKLSFRYKVEGEYYLTAPENVWDFGDIFYSTNGTAFSYLINPATNEPYTLYGNGNVAVNSGLLPLPASLNDLPTVYIGFEWLNDNADGTNPPLLIDDVLVTGQTSGAAVETQAGQTGNLNLISGNYKSYLYSNADSQLVAMVNNPSTAVGCLTGTLTGSGNGMQTIQTGSGTYNGTQKVIQLTPAVPNSTNTYTASFYFTANELAIWGPAKTALKILKVQDGVSLSSVLTRTNSEIITPTSVLDSSATTGVITYTGNFTGFSQFLLVEPALTLPVIFTDVKVKLQENNAVLSWTTSQEISSNGFDILRSLDGISFTSIGFIPGKGASVSLTPYQFIDNHLPPAGTIYYRVKEVSTTGESALSKVVSVRLQEGDNNLFTLSPNPVNDQVKIHFIHPVSSVKIEVKNAQGQSLITKVISQPSAVVTLKVDLLPAGIYFVQLTMGDKVATQKLIRE